MAKRKCPFCGAGWVHGNHLTGYWEYRCGTKTAAEGDGYVPGTECDKTCFCREVNRLTSGIESVIDYMNDEQERGRGVVSHFFMVRERLKELITPSVPAEGRGSEE